MVEVQATEDKGPVYYISRQLFMESSEFGIYRRHFFIFGGGIRAQVAGNIKIKKARI